MAWGALPSIHVHIAVDGVSVCWYPLSFFRDMSVYLHISISLVSSSLFVFRGNITQPEMSREFFFLDGTHLLGIFSL